MGRQHRTYKKQRKWRTDREEDRHINKTTKVADRVTNREKERHTKKGTVNRLPNVPNSDEV